MPPPPVVAIAAWILPGLGYILIGQRLRGIVIGASILLLFVAGLAIGGLRVLDSAVLESVDQRNLRLDEEESAARHARNASPPQAYSPPGLLVRTLRKPWSIGQLLTGPIAVAANYRAVTWGGNAGVPFSHARVNEIGVLYTAVAGMLNLMAIIDSAYRSSNNGGR